MTNRVTRFGQRQWLKHRYSQGQRERSKPEAHDPVLVSLGRSRRDTILKNHHNRHEKREYRVLLCTPPSMAAEVWFSDLAMGFKHTGIRHLRLSSESRLTGRELSSFSPNVVVALDHDKTLQNIDLNALNAYKRQNGCLRLFIPSREDLFLPRARLQKDDARRLENARSGKVADAYFSLYDKRLYHSHYSPWHKAGFPYLSLPQACNPLEDHPVAVDKKHDWFVATVNNPARQKCVWHTLRPIIKRYNGNWVGSGWGFGNPAITPSEFSTAYAQSKISLAPLISFLRANPAEISHRVFEAAACGAFQITSTCPLSGSFFSESAIVRVKSKHEFVSTFERWLPKEQERNRMAENALKEVYANHTIFHRIEALVEFLDQHHNRFSS